MALMLPLAALAQDAEFGADLTIGAQKKFGKKWSVGLEAEYRSLDNLKSTDRVGLGIDASYKAAKWMKFSAGYTFFYNYEPEKLSTYKDTDGAVLDGDADVGDPKYYSSGYFYPRHRFNVSVAVDKKLIGDFRFSLRERWQYTWRPEKTIERYSYLRDEMDEKTNNGKAHHVLRSRLQVEYDKKGLDFTPYLSVEFYNSWSLEKMRYTAGCDWDISKQHSLGIFYRYQNVRDGDDPDYHLIGVGYKIKF